MALIDVHWFLDLMNRHGVGVGVWLDGGWAVDACLGFQTRRHDDLDIEVEQRDLDKAVAALRDVGFDDVWRDDTSACGTSSWVIRAVGASTFT